MASIGPLAELLLLYAARAQHLEEVVRPALRRGDIVVSDRFNDASLAYQGCGRKLGAATVRSVDRIVSARTQPDLTLVLDLAPQRSPPGTSARNLNQPRGLDLSGLRNT